MYDVLVQISQDIIFSSQDPCTSDLSVAGFCALFQFFCVPDDAGMFAIGWKLSDKWADVQTCPGAPSSSPSEKSVRVFFPLNM